MVSRQTPKEDFPEVCAFEFFVYLGNKMIIESIRNINSLPFKQVFDPPFKIKYD